MRVILFIAISFLTIFSTKAKAQYSSPMTSESEVLYQEDQQPGLYHIEFVGWNYQRSDGTSRDSIPSESWMGDSMVGTIRITSTNSEYDNGYVSLHIIENIGTTYPRNGCIEFNLSELRTGTSKEVTFNLSVEGIGIQYISAYVGPDVCGGAASRYLWSNILNQKLNIKNTSFDTSVFSASLTGEGVTTSADGLYSVTPGKEFTVDVLYSVYDPSYSENGNSEVKLSIAGQTYVKSFSISDIWEQVNSNGAAHMLFQVKLPTTVVGDQELRAEINPSNIPEERSRLDNSITQVVHTGGALAEISVQSVRLAQVVYNPQISPIPSQKTPYVRLDKGSGSSFVAVLGKSASFEVTVQLQNKPAILPLGLYQVRIKKNGEVFLQSDYRSFQDFISSDSFVIDANLVLPLSPQKVWKPNIAGDWSLTAEVVSLDSSVSVKSPLSMSMHVTKTYTPTIGVVRVQPSDITQYSPVAEVKYIKHMQLSKYLSDVFPVEDNSILLQDSGVVVGTSFKDAGLVADLITLERQRLLMKVQRMVGIVSDGYFKSKSILEEGDIGFRDSNVPKVMIASESFQGALPHELAHSFGARMELYEFQGDKTFDGFNANILGVNNVPTKYVAVKSVMDFARSSDFDNGKVWPWIDDKIYSIIFGFLQNIEVDPETVLITGQLKKSGELVSANSYDIPNGVLTTNEPLGNLTVRLLDQNGKVLSSVTQTAQYSLEVTPSNLSRRLSTTVEIDRVPIAVQLPKNSSATNVVVLLSGKVVGNKSLLGMRLTGLIERIPLAEFKGLKCHSSKDKKSFQLKEKDDLIKLALKAQSALDYKELLKARLLLEALVVQLKLTTSSTYVPVNVDELSQSTVVSDIRKIIKSVSLNSAKRK